MILKFLAPSVAAFALMACSQADAPDVSLPTNVAGEAVDVAKDMATQVVGTKTTAAVIYADWCGSCKVLDPAVKKARSMGPVPGLKFVMLDYTAKDDADFYAQAEAAGISEAVTAHLDGTIKTGQILLIDMDDQIVIRKIDKSFDAPQILIALKAAVAES